MWTLGLSIFLYANCVRMYFMKLSDRVMQYSRILHMNRIIINFYDFTKWCKWVSEWLCGARSFVHSLVEEVLCRCLCELFGISVFNDGWTDVFVFLLSAMAYKLFDFFHSILSYTIQLTAYSTTAYVRHMNNFTQ